MSRVIPDGISLRELRVEFYDKEETDISIFVVWSDSDVIDSYTLRMMEYCLSNFIVGNGLHWESILLTDRTFRHKILNNT